MEKNKTKIIVFIVSVCFIFIGALIFFVIFFKDDENEKATDNKKTLVFSQEDITTVNEDTYHTVTFLGESGEIVETYMIKHGERLEKIPEVKSDTNIFAGWQYNDNDKFYVGMPVLEDMTIKSKWIDTEIIVINGLNNSGTNIEDVDLEALEDYIKRAEEAQNKADEDLESKEDNKKENDISE